MTDPIEAVARAMEADMWAEHELPVDDELHAKYRHTAACAIAAFLDAHSDPKAKMSERALLAGEAVYAKWNPDADDFPPVQDIFIAMIDALRAELLPPPGDG